MSVSDVEECGEERLRTAKYVSDDVLEQESRRTAGFELEDRELMFGQLQPRCEFADERASFVRLGPEIGSDAARRMKLLGKSGVAGLEAHDLRSPQSAGENIGSEHRRTHLLLQYLLLNEHPLLLHPRRILQRAPASPSLQLRLPPQPDILPLPLARRERLRPQFHLRPPEQIPRTPRLLLLSLSLLRRPKLRLDVLERIDDVTMLALAVLLAQTEVLGALLGARKARLVVLEFLGVDGGSESGGEVVSSGGEVGLELAGAEVPSTARRVGFEVLDLDPRDLGASFVKSRLQISCLTRSGSLGMQREKDALLAGSSCPASSLCLWRSSSSAVAILYNVDDFPLFLCSGPIPCSSGRRPSFSASSFA